MTDSNGTVFVIGGVNMDIAGTPSGALLPGDSNPGRVTIRWDAPPPICA